MVLLSRHDTSLVKRESRYTHTAKMPKWVINHVRVYTCIYIYIYICLSIYTYIYTYIHSHRFTHPHTARERAIWNLQTFFLLVTRASLWLIFRLMFLEFSVIWFGPLVIKFFCWWSTLWLNRDHSGAPATASSHGREDPLCPHQWCHTRHPCRFWKLNENIFKRIFLLNWKKTPEA